MARTPKAKAAQSLPGHETFGLYDSLLFIGKPDLSPYGFKRSRTVYQNELWPPKADYTTPNEVAVRSKARAVLAEGVTAAVPIILDVEQYSVDVRLDISHINRGDVVKTNFRSRCFIPEPANDVFQLADVGVNIRSVGINMRYIQPNVG